MKEALIEIRNLKTFLHTEKGILKAVNGVNLFLRRGEITGLAGESGCGKSMTAYSILRLVPNPPAKIIGGEIIFEGKNLLKISESDMRKIRGNEIAMIFQDPLTSLNPVFTVGNQLVEAIKLHQNIGRKEALKKAIEMLGLVNISEPEIRIKQYPHQFSGGMRQRIMIAMALACNPSLLIADEPTSALDVTIQAQILYLITELISKLNNSVLLITHDLGVIAEVCDFVYIMYAGKIVEYASAKEIFFGSKHPYTQKLMESMPTLNEQKDELTVIKGAVPSLINPPSGCSFHPRCPKIKTICCEEEPAFIEINSDHFVACFLS